MAEHCSEFLVHGVDVEGLQSGIEELRRATVENNFQHVQEEPLVQLLAASPVPVTCPDRYLSR